MNGLIRNSRFSKVAAFAVLAMLSLPVAESRATLGQPESSVETVRAAVSGIAQAPVSRATYRVRTVLASSLGTTIREYVTLDGKVFGVTWSGRVHPDLAPLLGSYLVEYKAALSQRTKIGIRSRSSRSEIRSTHLVLEKFGHMRAVRGRAYLPELLPGGIHGEDLE